MASKYGRSEYEALGYGLRSLIGIQYTLLTLLNRIQTISYGLPQDIIYFHFGDQQQWEHHDTLFSYKHTPLRTFENNFNKDFTFALNLQKFGNTFQARQFQQTKFTNLILNRIDLLYNRIWVKPFPSSFNINVGFTTALDLSINKFSGGSPLHTSTLHNDNDTKLLFLGLDATLPFINTYHYTLDVTTEAGTLGIFTSNGLMEFPTYTNWGAKVGVSQSIMHRKNNVSHIISTNGYITSGFFRPHFALHGYEYLQKPYYNRIINDMAQDVSDAKYTTFIVSPEIVYNIHSDFFTLDLGSYFPIALGGGDTILSDLHYNPIIYIESAIYITRRLPEFLDISLRALYSNSNIDYKSWGVNITDYLTYLGFQHSVLDTSLDISILGNYNISAGVFNTPQYDNNNELEFNTKTDLPKLAIEPYISFSYSLR